MGTKIQSKTYFPGYFPARDLKNSAGIGMWARYDEDKTSKNGHIYDPFLTSTSMEGYLGYEKEQVRQTIMKQESIFRHQLQELHRLYRRQRELMNELERREVHKHPLSVETLKSSLSLSQIPIENAKNSWHASDFPLAGSAFGSSSASGAEIIHSPISFIKGNSACSPLSSHGRLQTKDYESPNPKFNKFQKKMFDLELPADVYMNNEGKQQEERFCGMPGMESYRLQRNNEVTKRDMYTSPGSGLNCDSNFDALGSKLYSKRTRNLADLNEPILVEETSITDSVNNGRRIICLEEEGIQKRDIPTCSNSVSRFWSKEHSQSCHVEKDGLNFLKSKLPESDRNGNGVLTCNSNAGKMGVDEHASFAENSSELLRSLEIEPGKAHEPSTFSLSDKSNITPSRKKTIFGVEISEGTHNRSVHASYSPSLHTLYRHSATDSETLVSNCRKTSSASGQNGVSNQENSCLSTFSSFSGRPPNSLIRFPEFSGDKLNNNLRTITSSRSEVSKQNAICFGSRSDGKPSEGCLDLNSYVATPDKFQSEVVLQQNAASESIREPHCNGNHITTKEISYQMNLNSLQNHSQHFFSKANMTKDPSKDFTSPTSALESKTNKVDNADCQSSRRIMGFPIVDVPHTSNDLTSVKSPFKYTHHASKLIRDGTETISQFEVKGVVAENALNHNSSGLRHQIDLNLSLDEEETPSASSVPRAIVKIATKEIDLEAPAVLESDTDVSAEADFPEQNTIIPSKVSLDESGEGFEELVRVAAKAIVDISSSRLDVADPSCQKPEASPSDCLLWFAEAISSHESRVGTRLNAVVDANDEKSIPEGMDYFEFMTLKLKDTKEEEYCYKTPGLENPNDEEKRATSVPRRPRRGQARRGRQRKDFQRDILPGLVSLSRHEVTEDILTIEEMFKASGGTWQSSLSQRKIAKSGRGRRLSAVLAPSPAANEVVPPPVQQQQPIYGELGFEDRNLTGWGKRTRRLPRQRCSTGKFIVQS